MIKILTKKIQSHLGNYFSSSTRMKKPEIRCLKNMPLGVLKSKSVFINQIAASLGESLKLKKATKRLSAQYLKETFATDELNAHL